MKFPQNFIWGAAAAAYQIEGGFDADGKGLSVWDVMCRKPGAIADKSSGDVACDHYHKFKDDVGLMKGMGVRAYRFSVSWPRVIHDGTGAVNEKGLAFYDRLVDALLAAGITPFCTLFHWDFPQSLQLKNGWLNPDSPQWFADYARVVADKLSDRVTNWMTFNEPQCTVSLGHEKGIHAPGLKLGAADLLQIMHNILLAHGRAVQTLRGACKSKPQIGWAPVGNGRLPHSDSPEDIEAARRGAMSAAGRTFWTNTMFADPVIFGKYPEDGLRDWGSDMPKIGPHDMEIIQQPLDFYGANIYHDQTVRAGENGEPVIVPPEFGSAITAFGWQVTPASLYWTPKFLFERYKLPIYITENGMANVDWVHADGAVHDPQRIDFTRRYLIELQKGIRDGVDVRGYFHWSIMDNFEWAEGYTKRFGMIHVDYATQKRTLKDSAKWYAEIIRTNGQAVAD